MGHLTTSRVSWKWANACWWVDCSPSFISLESFIVFVCPVPAHSFSGNNNLISFGSISPWFTVYVVQSITSLSAPGWAHGLDILPPQVMAMKYSPKIFFEIFGKRLSFHWSYEITEMDVELLAAFLPCSGEMGLERGKHLNPALPVQSYPRLFTDTNQYISFLP